MPELRISESLSLPIDVLAMASAIFGIRGSGKTNTAGVIVEEALSLGQRTAILDPLDVWWGLKSSADGAKPGYDVVIFGGPHQDLPLLHDQGAILARLIVENPISAIFSLRHLRKHQQVRFAAEFLEELYHLKGDPQHRDRLFLAIDECSTFVPQSFTRGGKDSGEKDYTARCVGAVEDTIRRGRNAGFGVCLIDQRPASVNKNALSQAELLILHRVVSPQDRKALREYSEANDDQGKSAVLFDTLAQLGQADGTKGEAWVWSPLLDIFQRTQIRMRHTFDSSKTPEHGETPILPTDAAKVDLESIRTMLAGALDEAEANDPKTLQKRIAELERQVAEGSSSESIVQQRVDVATAPLLNKINELEFSFKEASGIARMIIDAHEKLFEFEQRLGRILHLEGYVAAETIKTAEIDRVTEALLTREPAPKPKPPREPQPGDAKISSPQQRILDAILTLNTVGIREPQREHVALYADASPTSGAYANNISRLNVEGYLRYPIPGRLQLTEKGMRVARGPDKPASLAGLHERWCSLLSSPQAAILREVIRVSPRAIPREVLATRLGVSPTSGAYANNVSRLSSLGLVSYPTKGLVAATALLFPEGLK